MELSIIFVPALDVSLVLFFKLKICIIDSYLFIYESLILNVHIIYKKYKHINSFLLVKKLEIS